MIDYREILRLHSQNHSQRRIETSVHSSHQTVKAVLENAAKYLLLFMPYCLSMQMRQRCTMKSKTNTQ